MFAGMPDRAYARTLNGIRILVDLKDHDGRILYLFGTNDPKVHHVVQALLGRTDVFLDIGANHASIGLLAADRVGPLGRVHLFEPQPDLCKVVKAAINDGRRLNVTLHEIALMDCDGKMELTRPAHHSGKATVIRHENHQAGRRSPFR